MNMYSSQSLAYWSCAWPYRTTVTVQETSATTLTNYQLKLTITGTHLNGDYNWSDHGFDLRVVDSDDKSLMNYWMEDWDKNNKVATVWVNVNRLSEYENKKIYIYYGNEFSKHLIKAPFIDPAISSSTVVFGEHASASDNCQQENLQYGLNDTQGVNGYIDSTTLASKTEMALGLVRGRMYSARSSHESNLPRACLGSFKNAINSIKDSTITFDFNAQILSNPDNTLSAKTIYKTLLALLSFVRTCDQFDCVIGDDEVMEVNPGSFRESSASNDVTVGIFGNHGIGLSEDEYDVIEIRSFGTLNFDSSVYNEFLIDKLDAGFNSIIRFSAGTYWINELDLSLGSELIVVGDGPVRLYVNNLIDWSSDVLINSPGIGVQGNSEDMLMYFYGPVNMGDQTTFSGSLFSPEFIDLDSNGRFFGLITAENVTVGFETKVTYDENAYFGMSDITWCYDGPEPVDGINISASSAAVNCQPSEISIQLLDDTGAVITDFAGIILLTTSTSHGDWSLAAGANGVLSNGGVDDGAASYKMVANDLGVVSFYLSNTHPEITSITVAAESVTQTADIVFQSAGFIFSNIETQVAAKQSASIGLQAVETDSVTGACNELLVGNQDVKMAIECLSPNNCGSAVSKINTTQVTSVHSGGVTTAVGNYVPLDFGNSSDDDASFSFNYDNSGSLRVWAMYELRLENGAASGNFVSGSSNNFVVAPAGFCLQASDDNWPCSVPGLTGNCSAFKPAGDNFNVTMSAKVYDINGDYCNVASTTNFAGEVSLSHNLVSPDLASGGDSGTLSVNSATLANGTISLAVNVSDMGVYTLSAGGNRYLGVDLPSNDSQNIGRFYPKDFYIESTTAAIYSDSNGSFSYTGQLHSNGDGAISYALVPSFNYQVRGFSAQTLKNYLPPLASTATVSASAFSKKLGSLGNALSVSSGFSAGVVTGPDSNYEYTYTFNDADHFVFNQDSNSLLAPFNNDIGINISDFSTSIDSISLANGPVLITGSGGQIRYGRLHLQNAYGPETSVVSQSWHMQYFDGAVFRINTLDDVSAYDLADIGAISVTDTGDSSAPLLNTDSSASTSAGAIGQFNKGVLTVDWSAPLNGHFGNYLFPLNVASWLQYDWFESGRENPQGNVSFGQYRGHDKVIYWQEINY